MANLGSAEIFEYIARNSTRHSRDDPWWVSENTALEASRVELRSELESTGGVVVGPVGFVHFSYVEMGNINSLDLFGLDELILFSFYWKNRARYRAVADMGANIGLHSVILGRMGLQVTAYEPDTTHVELLRNHLVANSLLDQIQVVQAAVAETEGVLEFVRVLGNTTGSHVFGAKQDPYGELEIIKVQGVSVLDAVKGVDLVKMDVEGLEANLLTRLRPNDFEATDIVCEVGNSRNSEIIWDHFSKMEGVNLFAQKTGWSRVINKAGMPCSYKEGSLFISCLESMPWMPPEPPKL